MAENSNISTKDEVNEIEKIDMALDSSKDFVEKNKKGLLIGICAIAVIILGVFGYFKGIKAPKEEKAAVALYKAEHEFARDSFKVALNGNGNDIAGFLKVINQYGSTKAGNVAKAYAGLCYKQLGDNNNAVKYLSDYDSEDGTILEPSIYVALGSCNWDLNKLDDAIKYYQKAIDADNETVSPVALFHLGVLYIKKGDKANAKAQFQDMKDKYSQNPLSNDADKYIALCE